jgi:hypothetical protein
MYKIKKENFEHFLWSDMFKATEKQVNDLHPDLKNVPLGIKNYRFFRVSIMKMLKSTTKTTSLPNDQNLEFLSKLKDTSLEEKIKSTGILFFVQPLYKLFEFLDNDMLNIYFF